MIKLREEILEDIRGLADEKYKEFHSGLCPETDNILGVRVPVLRKYAKQLSDFAGKEIIEILEMNTMKKLY